jgi:integrase
VLRAQRHSRGSVRFDKRRRTWNYLYYDGPTRRSKLIGTKQQYPTKAAAWKAAESILKRPRNVPNTPTVATLVEHYREEKIPKRASTRRGYEVYLRKHILPKWQDVSITELQARPVELWLRTLELAPKSKVHVRGLLHTLWDYAMWRGDVPTQRNPMELVEVRNASKRLQKPRTMTIEEFHRLSAVLTEPYRTMATVGMPRIAMVRNCGAEVAGHKLD